jgi:hypothetical protein
MPSCICHVDEKNSTTLAQPASPGRPSQSARWFWPLNIIKEVINFFWCPYKSLLRFN